MDPLGSPCPPGAGAPPPELAGREEIIASATVALARVRLGRPEKSQMLLGLRGVGCANAINASAQGSTWTISINARFSTAHAFPSAFSSGTRASIEARNAARGVRMPWAMALPRVSSESGDVSRDRVRDLACLGTRSVAEASGVAAQRRCQAGVSAGPPRSLDARLAESRKVFPFSPAKTSRVSSSFRVEELDTCRTIRQSGKDRRPWKCLPLRSPTEPHHL